MPVDANIFNNNKTFQDYQLQNLQGQLVAAQAKKAMTPDLDELGQRAYLKAANGLPLDPSEQAALSYIDQKSQTFGFNPATGRLEQKPSLLQRIGMPQGQPQPTSPMPQQAPTAAINPNGAFAQAMGGGKSIGTGDPLADMGVTNPMLSPKSEQKLSEANIESGRKRVDELIGAAQSASSLARSAEIMQKLQPRLGYTGTGGQLIGGLDKALTGIGAGGLIGGDPDARELFQSQGVEGWMKTAEPLKGAFTEKEGARIDIAIPSLSKTPEGIRKITELSKIMGERAQEKANFFEQYFAQKGDLTGAEAIWNDYAEKNPILTDEFFGIKPSKPKTKQEFNAKQAPESTVSGKDEFNSIAAARAAIKTGKSKEAVRQRLIDAGIDPSKAGL